MVPLLTALIIVSVLVLFAAVMIVKRRLREKRTAEMQKVAMMQGFNFQEEPPRAFLAPLAAGFELFEHGNRRDAPRNVMEGSAGEYDATFFDYTYYTRTSSYANGNYTSSESAHNNQVAVLKLKNVNLPSYSLRKEHFGDRLKDKIGMHDIDLPALPDFSQAYYLKGDDDAAVAAVFTPDVVLRFMEKGLQKGEGIEAQDSRLMFYRTRFVKAEEYPDFINRAGEIAGYFERTEEE